MSPTSKAQPTSTKGRKKRPLLDGDDYVPRKRLRHWIVEMLNSQSVHGVRWIDKEKTLFRIPWKHAGKTDWRDRDFEIFKLWAKNRGTYKNGNKLDPSTLKSRLRCALSKLPDIVELRERSFVEGVEPYRVYRLLPAVPRKRLRHWIVEMLDSEALHGLRWIDKDQKLFRIPWKHAGKTDWNGRDFEIFRAWARNRGKYNKGDKLDASTLKGRLRCALNKLPDIEELPERSWLKGNEPFRVYRLLSGPSKNQEIYPRCTWTEEASHQESNASLSLSQDNMIYPSNYEMAVELRYKGTTVSSMTVTNPSGCWIRYESCESEVTCDAADMSSSSSELHFQHLHHVNFVDCRSYATSQKQIKLTEYILENAKEGLIICFRGDSVYVKRLCKMRVFARLPCWSNSQTKLERNQWVKLFNFNQFQSALNPYAGCSATEQNDSIDFSIGQSWTNSRSVDDNLVTISIIPWSSKK